MSAENFGVPLTKRLSVAASLLSGGDGVVDIGTDHAYLPAYLVLSGKCPHVLACDVGEKPLANAEKTLREFALQDRIEPRISDGLQNVSPDEAREISVCGMGGTLIARILTAAPWIRRPGMHLVLQPMTHLEDVHACLCKNGFRIEREPCVQEGRRVYCFVDAVFDGQTRPDDPGYFYFGELIGQDGPARHVVQKQLMRLQKRIACLEAAGIRPEEASYLKEAVVYYERNRHENP